MTHHPVDTSWWEAKDHATFLAFNWDHPSRRLGTAAALRAADGGTLVEVGPGNGVDYERAFRPAVLAGDVAYIGWEATARFCDALRARYPEATWHHAPLQSLLPRSCDVLYARAVLEHQADPLAALRVLLSAARRTVVLDWYRPPAATASCDWAGVVPCHTVERAAALAVVRAARCALETEQPADGNLVWTLTRIAPPR